MKGPAHISAPVKELIDETERMLTSELIIQRDRECPTSGMLLDSYSYRVHSNIIVYPASYLGLLKDLVIAWNCAKLLFMGLAHRHGDLKILSYSPETAMAAAEQIYLDILKDDRTRSLEMKRKKKLIPFIFQILYGGLSEIPSGIVAHMFIAGNYPLLRNAQIYLLLKEGVQNMHELVPVRDLLPRRYFALRNALYYTRDALLARYLSAYPLNPVINIPELRRFRNLDLKEMITHRWTGSVWYHTKIAGDDLLSRTSAILGGRMHMFSPPVDYRAIFDTGRGIAEVWQERMAMKSWFCWTDPSLITRSERRIKEIEEQMIAKIFAG